MLALRLVLETCLKICFPSLAPLRQLVFQRETYLPYYPRFHEPDGPTACTNVQDGIICSFFAVTYGKAEPPSWSLLVEHLAVRLNWMH